MRKGSSASSIASATLALTAQGALASTKATAAEASVVSVSVAESSGTADAAPEHVQAALQPTVSAIPEASTEASEVQ